MFNKEILIFTHLWKCWQLKLTMCSFCIINFNLIFRTTLKDQYTLRTVFDTGAPGLKPGDPLNLKNYKLDGWEHILRGNTGLGNSRLRIPEAVDPGTLIFKMKKKKLKIFWIFFELIFSKVKLKIKLTGVRCRPMKLKFSTSVGNITWKIEENSGLWNTTRKLRPISRVSGLTEILRNTNGQTLVGSDFRQTSGGLVLTGLLWVFNFMNRN